MTTAIGFRRIFVLLGCLCLAGVAAARTGDAVRLDHSPVVDGDVRGDSAWRGVRPITGFTQVRPEEGTRASQPTEVFIGFTEDALHIGVVCYDDDPGSIIVTNSQRDASLDQSDSFLIVIDSFRSEQNGFVFGTNPAGLQYDGQVTSERSSNSGFDLNWDTSWEVQTTIDDEGWSAEFAIPFQSLRYGNNRSQSWGMNFQRNIRGNNEIVYWAPLPVQHDLQRLSLAGTVNNIEAPAKRNLKFVPYVLGKTTEGGSLARSESDSEFGLDLKYSLTPSLTLDATYNTDFAQVEVDQQQVNLDRFSLFFPEKRPFFLENAGQFSVGIPGQVELFFSRRIGIGPGGIQLPINAGARISGTLGSATNVGLLQMQSEGVPGIAPKNDFSVARIRQEFANRSSIGGLFVNRSGGDDDNQTYAIDGTWGIGEDGRIQAFAAKTSTPGISGDDYAWHASGNYESETWSYNGGYTEVAEGFNPEVGFLSRRSYRKVEGFIQRRYRLKGAQRLLELRPHARYRGYWNFDGDYESGFLHLDNSNEWKNGARASTALNFSHESVVEAFDIVNGITVAAGDYDHKEVHLSASSNPSAPFNGSLSVRRGGFFGGDRVNVSPSVNYRIGQTFRTSLSWDHSDIDLPGGSFTVNLSRVRLSYSFSPKITAQLLLQHNSRDDVFSTNFRFSWLQSANAGLYVVYNEIDDEVNSPGRPGRELVVKYSRIFDVGG